MKKFIASLIIIISLLVSCGPVRYVQPIQDQNYGYSRMYYSMNKVLTMTQVDSMITVDRLAPLDEWPNNINGERKALLIQYYYIKSLETNNELIYVLTQTQVDTIFRCTKRVTEEMK